MLVTAPSTPRDSPKQADSVSESVKLITRRRRRPTPTHSTSNAAPVALRISH